MADPTWEFTRLHPVDGTFSKTQRVYNERYQGIVTNSVTGFTIPVALSAFLQEYPYGSPHPDDPTTTLTGVSPQLDEDNRIRWTFDVEYSWENNTGASQTDPAITLSEEADLTPADLPWQRRTRRGLRFISRTIATELDRNGDAILNRVDLPPDPPVTYTRYDHVLTYDFALQFFNEQEGKDYVGKINSAKWGPYESETLQIVDFSANEEYEGTQYFVDLHVELEYNKDGWDRTLLSTANVEVYDGTTNIEEYDGYENVNQGDLIPIFTTYGIPTSGFYADGPLPIKADLKALRSGDAAEPHTFEVELFDRLDFNTIPYITPPLTINN